MSVDGYLELCKNVIHCLLMTMITLFIVVAPICMIGGLIYEFTKPISLFIQYVRNYFSEE